MQRSFEKFMQVLAQNRDKFFENWYQFDSKIFFVTITLVYICLLLLKRTFVIADIAAFEILQEQGQMWVFDILFGIQYLSVPFFLAWKFTLTAFIIWVGCFMFGYRVTYAQLWRWVMFSELVFLLPEFIKFIWFLNWGGDPTYQDIVAFYPLSLINLVDYTAANPRLHYPLKSLNVFELFYWFILIVGVFYLSGKKWKYSVYIVSSSYILFYFIWLVFYIMVYD